MQAPFDDNLKEIADSMGVALYQRFTPVEASLFLRCPVEEVVKLQKRHKIECIVVTDGKFEFFGYQLLQYLLSTISGVAPSPATSPESGERIIRSQEIQSMTGLSRTTIWRMERKDEFPARVPLSSGSVGWRLSEVEAWIRDR